MTRTLGFTSFLTALMMIGNCSLMAAAEEATEDFHYSFELQPGGQLDLNNTNGSVEIIGWDRPSLDVSGTKYSSDASHLKEIKVKVNTSGKDATIKTYVPQNDWHGSYGVRYRIHAPRHMVLRQVETTNGSVTAEQLSGGGHIRSTNGKLVLTDLTGDYLAETTNGPIEMEHCSGLERAESTNGGVRGHLEEGAIEANSTNGTLDITVNKPRQGQPIRMTTTNGSLTLAMAEFHNNPIHAETTHGSVTLRLPGNTNAKLRAETSMASIHNELPLSSTEESSKNELRGQIGSGGPEIMATSNMGSIRIGRY